MHAKDTGSQETITNGDVEDLKELLQAVRLLQEFLQAALPTLQHNPMKIIDAE